MELSLINILLQNHYSIFFATPFLLSQNLHKSAVSNSISIMQSDITKIDWESCSKNVISYDRDDLPSNIRAIKVEQMDSMALREAYNLIGGEVTSVQIEVEQPEGLVGFPHDYLTNSGSFQVDIEPFNISNGFNRTTTAHLERSIRDAFDTKINNATEEEHKLHLEEWQNAILAMSGSASKLWPGSYKNLWLRSDGRFDQVEKQSFHRHGEYHDMLGGHGRLPGYFLNFTPSYDGTMFPGTDGNLWFGKGGNYTIFATDGHPHVDGCDHEAPIQFQSPIKGEKRATAVLGIYPVHDIVNHNENHNEPT